jgi:hypothetical protein
MQIEEPYFVDGAGRKHVRYTIQSLGPTQGFGILDVLTSSYVDVCFQTRAEARDWLNKTERARAAGA